MTVLRRAAITSTLLFAAAAIAAAAAAGDGGPSPGISFGGDGITGPGGALRYVTIPTDGGTIVETIRVSDSHVLRWTELRGDTVGIPYVTSDGATGGLTRDLRTLILAGYATAPG